MSKRKKKKYKKHINYVAPEPVNNSNSDNEILEKNSLVEKVNIDASEKFFINSVLIVTLVILISPNKILNIISIFINKILP